MGTDASGNLDALLQKMQSDSREFHRLWLGQMVFTWRWWLLLALTVVPWILWGIFRKKESTSRLLYAGLFSVVISKLLDAIGSSFGLWVYTVRLIPLFPPFFPWDTTLMPVAVMAFLQFRPGMHALVKAAVFALTAAFVAEPLGVWLRLYLPEHWSHFYSFPIYMAIYLAADRMSKSGRFERV